MAVLVDDNGVAKWLLANLGDSRIYRITDGRLEQISVDHSVVQELIDSGQITAEEARSTPSATSSPARWAAPEGIEPDFFLLPLGSVERLLLCSDGVTGMIEDKEIEEILETVADPRDAADSLVRAAVAAGGRDNATAIVVDVVGLVKDATLRLPAPAGEPRIQAGGTTVSTEARFATGDWYAVVGDHVTVLLPGQPARPRGRPLGPRRLRCRRRRRCSTPSSPAGCPRSTTSPSSPTATTPPA